MVKRSLSLSLLVAGFMATTPGFAQDETNETEKVIFGEFGNPADFKIDTSMPQYPAAALLGQADSVVNNVATPEDFGMQLLNQFGEDGDLELGFAIGGNPYWWFGRNSSMTFREYAADDKKLSRILARTNVSVGAIQLSTGTTLQPSEGYRVAFGASTEFFDSADARMDVVNRGCIISAVTAINASDATDRLIIRLAVANTIRADKFDVSTGALVQWADQMTQVEQQAADAALAEIGGLAALSGQLSQNVRDQIAILEAQYKTNPNGADFGGREQKVAAANEALRACEKGADKRLQSARSLRVGVAVAGRDNGGSSDDFEFDGASAWGSLRLPLGGEDASLNSFGVFVLGELDATETVESEMDMMMDPSTPAMPSGSDMSAMSEDVIAMSEDAVVTEYDGWRIGANVNSVRDDLTISASIAYVNQEFSSDMVPDRDFVLTTATASYKIREGLWLEGSFGVSSGDGFEAEEFAGIRIKADLGRLGLRM